MEDDESAGKGRLASMENVSPDSTRWQGGRGHPPEGASKIEGKTAMKRRLFFGGILIIVVLGAISLYMAVRRPQPIELTGIVTTHEVNVSSQVQGRLVRLLVKEGDSVKPGELLALVDPQELKADQSYYLNTARGTAAQVEEEKAALNFQRAQTVDQIRQAEAALAAAEALVSEAKTDLDYSRVNFERTDALSRKQLVSAQSLDQARSTYEAGKAHVQSLEKQVEAQKAAVALARSNEHQITIRLNQLIAGERQLAAANAQSEKAKVRLGYTQIQAPLGGTVSILDARQGEVVNIGQPILTLINPDDLWVRGDVEETYIEKIRLGDSLKVRFPSGEERMGTVFFRGVDADYATQRDVSRTKRDIRTFEIRLRVDNRDRRLWPGLTALILLPFSDPR
jgi:HlyD family secretion protein